MREVAENTGGWGKVPLGTVADIRLSSVDKKSEPGEIPVRLCNYTDVYNNDHVTADMDFMRATATRTEIDRFGVQVGDVIITKDSETPDDIGVPAVIDSTAPDLVCGYHLAMIRPDQSAVDPTFLAKQLADWRIARYFGQQANGTTRYGLSTASIANVVLRLPPVEQQRAASQITRLLNAAIAQTEAVIAKLKSVRAGLLHDLLTRGLDANGQLRPPPDQAPHLYKDSPLGKIPREWEYGGLRDRASSARPYLKTGPFGSSLKQEHWTEQGVPVVTIGSLGEGEFISSALLHVSSATACGLSSYALFPGDIVFSRVADVGRSVVVQEAENGWIMSSNMMWISLDQARIVPRYVQLHIAGNPAMRAQVRALVNAGGRDVANAEIMDSLVFPWPPKEEQDVVVGRLLAFDTDMQAKAHEMRKMRLVKSGLMADLLTGRVRAKAEG